MGQATDLSDDLGYFRWLINSNRLSWKTYWDFFEESVVRNLPMPIDRRPLGCGVGTHNTWVTPSPSMGRDVRPQLRGASRTHFEAQVEGPESDKTLS
jgi:hypothetical protein